MQCQDRAESHSGPGAHHAHVSKFVQITRPPATRYRHVTSDKLPHLTLVLGVRGGGEGGLGPGHGHAAVSSPGRGQLS